MQVQHSEVQMIDEYSLLPISKKKSTRARKWREIEDIKAQQSLTRELKDIDQSYEFSLSSLV